jgi:phosphoribosylanthranilate isomerase
MKIKICGLFREEDIAYVNEVKPDYVGFVFAKSKRQVTYQQAKHLKSLLSKDIKAVGVFVDENIGFIEKLVNDHIIDMVQLHGHEDEAYINNLKQKINTIIIKAIQVNEKKDLDISYDVDYYLLDNKIAGSGETFDWNLIKQMNKPIFLAGGICLDNIDEALLIDVYALDVSSGAETNGVKDYTKIKEIVRRVRDEQR